MKKRNVDKDPEIVDSGSAFLYEGEPGSIALRRYVKLRPGGEYVAHTVIDDKGRPGEKPVSPFDRTVGGQSDQSAMPRIQQNTKEVFEMVNALKAEAGAYIDFKTRGKGSASALYRVLSATAHKHGEHIADATILREEYHSSFREALDDRAARRALPFGLDRVEKEITDIADQLNRVREAVYTAFFNEEDAPYQLHIQSPMQDEAMARLTAFGKETMGAICAVDDLWWATARASEELPKETWQKMVDQIRIAIGRAREAYEDLQEALQLAGMEDEIPYLDSLVTQREKPEGLLPMLDGILDMARSEAVFKKAMEGGRVSLKQRHR